MEKTSPTPLPFIYFSIPDNSADPDFPADSGPVFTRVRAAACVCGVRKRGMALRQEDSEGPFSKVCLPTRVSFPFSMIMRFFLSTQKEFVVSFFRESEKNKTINSYWI